MDKIIEFFTKLYGVKQINGNTLKFIYFNIMHLTITLENGIYKIINHKTKEKYEFESEEIAMNFLQSIILKYNIFDAGKSDVFFQYLTINKIFNKLDISKCEKAWISIENNDLFGYCNIKIYFKTKSILCNYHPGIFKDYVNIFHDTEKTKLPINYHEVIVNYINTLIDDYNKQEVEFEKALVNN